MNALRILLLVLAVGVLGLVGWRATIAPTVPNTPAAAGTPPPNVVALTEAMRQPSAPPPLSSLPVVSPAPAPTPSPDPTTAIPEFSSFYGRLKQDFPHDFDSLFDRSHLDQSADAAIWDALRSLEQKQGILAAQAGDTALDRFFDARSAMLEGLAPLNARQCVDFLYGVTDASIVDFTAAHHGLVATLADRTLDAIADGRLHHVDRATPTSDDLNALSAALAAHGLSSEEIGLLIDGTTPDPPLSDGRTCAIGRTYLDVLHDLPSDTRDRIYGLAAELLARS